MLYRELRFGWAMQAMGRQLAAEGGLIRDDLPKTPSGRTQVEAADERFAVLVAEAEHDPDNWRVWFRLALGYDESRDRKRARSAMRTAVGLYRGGAVSGSQA
jgi:Flp pilus assembly protein TadD